MIENIVNDNDKFKLLNVDPTISREKKLQRYLLKLKKKNAFTEDEYKSLYPVGSNIARIYGTPKIHKIDKEVTDTKEIIKKLKLRPIISSIGTYNYNLAKYLTGKLAPHMPKKHCVNDTFSFVKDINNLKCNNKYLTSFDVVSLYTNIPLNETIELAVDLIKKNDEKLKISRTELRQLFEFATSETHFLFEGKIFDQIDGVAMGSPLAPVLANLFMGYHENNWLKNYKGASPIIYKRYVDDIFCLFDKKDDATEFLQYLNNQHPNIKFTDEPEKEGKLPFLDVNIAKREGGFVTSIFHKPSYTGLLTNFLSFSPKTYKTALVKTLVHRIFNICSNWKIFQIDIDKMKNTLQRNKFPPSFIDNVVKKYLDQIYQKEEKQTQKRKANYFKLPYIGEISNNTQKKIRDLCKRYCKEMDITLIFNTCKIGSFFSSKSKCPSYLQSFVVYRFKCTSCGASYVGQTTRHCSVRVGEHLHTDKASHIYKHINSNENCKQANDETSFKIIDRANTEYTLKLKEAMHIKWLKPSLNSQKYHLNLTLPI